MVDDLVPKEMSCSFASLCCGCLLGACGKCFENLANHGLGHVEAIS